MSEFDNKKELIKKIKSFIFQDINEILKEGEVIRIVIEIQKHLLNDKLFDNKILIQKLQESFLEEDFLKNIRRVHKSEL